MAWPDKKFLKCAWHLVGVVVLLLVMACSRPEPDTANPVVEDGTSAVSPTASVDLDTSDTVDGPHHARGFSLRAGEGVVELVIDAPWTAGARRFRLVPREAAEQTERDGEGSGPVDAVREIRVPVQRLATTSTTELPHLEALGALDVLVGHAGIEFVYSEAVRKRIESGAVASIGNPSALDIERLLELAPEVLLVDSSGDAQAADLAVLERAGIVIVPMPAHLETTPLARAEWLRVSGALLDRDDRAREVLGGIEDRYETLRSTVASAVAEGARPAVLVGAPWNEVWWVPAADSWSARLLADAGATYPWAEQPGTSLPLDVEKVIDKALDAEIWLHPSHWRTLAEISTADSRLGAFAAFGAGQVWSHDRRRTEQGDDYFESGTLWPDRILADLVHIFHPELFPDHELVYYRRLEPR